MSGDCERLDILVRKEPAHRRHNSKYRYTVSLNDHSMKAMLCVEVTVVRKEKKHEIWGETKLQRG